MTDGFSRKIVGHHVHGVHVDIDACAQAPASAPAGGYVAGA
ncbi:hypothetical protein [Burkholderia ubonensis]|nr:hypothetical protein [Burkholderia ubonensis]